MTQQEAKTHLEKSAIIAAKIGMNSRGAGWTSQGAHVISVLRVLAKEVFGVTLTEQHIKAAKAADLGKNGFGCNGSQFRQWVENKGERDTAAASSEGLADLLAELPEAE